MDRMEIEWKAEKAPSLEDVLSGSSERGPVIDLVWLGQAGFAIRSGEKLLIVDPYLSDSLAEKYRDGWFKHQRLMEIPVRPERIRGVNHVLSSHAHTDHMDPETLKALSAANPACGFIVPAASVEEAVRRGVPKDRIVAAGAGREIVCSPEVRITGVASSHEEFETDERGEHRYLGYVFQLGDVRIYHSGDCVPYTGLAESLKRMDVHVALLPVNGRDSYRLSHGIAGNFTIPEAVEICERAGIRILVVHHFGMFAYNTVTEEDLESLKKSRPERLQVIVPDVRHVYRIVRKKG